MEGFPFAYQNRNRQFEFNYDFYRHVACVTYIDICNASHMPVKVVIKFELTIPILISERKSFHAVVSSICPSIAVSFKILELAIT